MYITESNNEWRGHHNSKQITVALKIDHQVILLAFLLSGISHFASTQKGGTVDTSCLHDLSIDNNVSDYTFTPEDERLFLLDLYDATGGPYY